jgi:small conductance mechanosensitive channel
LVVASLLLVQPAGAQEQDPPVEQLPLTEEFLLEFEALENTIEQVEEDIADIESRVPDTDGLMLEILSARLEGLWIASLEEGVEYAEAVVARQEEGFVVDEFEPTAVELLQTNIDIGEIAWMQSTERTVLPDSTLGAAEQAAAYRKFFDVERNTDLIIALVADSYALLQAFGVDAGDAEASFHDRIRERAINVSVYLDISLNDAAGLSAGLDALPGDAELAALLAVADTRVAQTASVLERVIGELDEIGDDTATYSQQLLTTTGEITTEFFDVDVIGGLLSRWGQSLLDMIVVEGPSFLVQVLLFVVIVFFSLRLAALTRRLAEHGLKKSNADLSRLLRRMLISTAGNVVLAVGILIALSQVGISLGPLLAGLGIAGFVIGFALQDSLSNFASGLMILFYRPFDVGDLVEIGGSAGEVKQMSLVNTTIHTLDNQRIILPNTMIWSGVIKNVTAQKVRRVDMLFGISYSDDIQKTERILQALLDEHDLVLDQPEPFVRLHELGDSSVNFIVRPWAKTEDYWEVYWDITRSVKIRFDEEGISIPFPQRDIHIKAQIPTVT